jgi:heat shock protein HtpX
VLFGGSGHADEDEDAVGFGGLLSGVLLILLAPIAAILIQMAISRSREYGADETGARIHGHPESLARALEQLELGSSLRPLPVNPAASHLFIVNPVTGMRLASLFSTHPPIAERIRRLREMPDPPRSRLLHTPDAIRLAPN